MTSIRVFFSRILDLLLRRKREERLSEELHAHLDLLTDEYVASGMSEDEARLAARRAFGGVLQVKMNYRDQRGLPSVDGVLQDLRFAARLLAKDRRFTLTAVVALGLGIGVTNTIFTLVNTVIIRDLPFHEPDRLVSVRMRSATGLEGGVSYADYRDWRESATTFEGMAAWSLTSTNLSDEGRAPERLRGTYISSNTFRLLHSAPIVGRDFLATDDQPGAPSVTIISYGIWQARYGGDVAVIGRAVRINDVPSTIIGVMPARFGFPFFQDTWQPLSLMPGIDSAKRDARRLEVFGRLSDPVDLPRARAEVDTIASQLAHEYPDTNKDTTTSLIRLKDRRPDGRAILMMMMGAAGFVLLIACINVANLLLARSVQRSREIAIRASLGATRWRIARQVLVECVLLATCAGALGVLLSVYGVKVLGVAVDVIDVASPGQSNSPYWADFSMNAPVFLFVAGLCLVTGLVFGLAPALLVSKTDVNATLKDGGRGGVGGRHARRWTGAFVAAELALTLMLLSGAGLLWRNFLAYYRADLLIDASDLVTMRLGLPIQKYATLEQQQRFLTQLDERLVARSDVFRATIASYIPYALSLTVSRQLTIDGRQPQTRDVPSVRYAFIGPRYFETLGLPMALGRALEAHDDRPRQEGAIVDQRFAALFFPGENPLGRRIQLSSANAAGQTSPWLSIVGVVPTLMQAEPVRAPDQGAPIPVVYVPVGLEPAPRNVALIVRRPTSSEHPHGRRATAIGEDPELGAIVSAVREDVRAVDPDLPVFAIQTMDAALEQFRSPNRLIGTWFGILAGIALVLASVGLYALTAHSVASRTQEIGVRMALGAQAPDVMKLFVRRAVPQLGVGLMLGIAGALATGQLLQTWLTQTAPRDPVTLILVSTVLILVSIVACVVPARRAARLDPVIALRKE